MAVIPASATREQGHASAWINLGGWPVDPSEEAPAMIWPNSIRTFDRMRRSSQIRSVLWGLTLPMRRPIWSLDPQEARPEVTQQLSEDLGLPVLGAGAPPKPKRKASRLSWAEHLRLGLLALSYGHMAFNPVYDARALKETGQARLRQLAPRFPATLQKINTDDAGELVSVEQFPVSGANSPGPGVELKRPSQLAFYSIDREGAAWQGQSVLRAVYAEWLLKDREMRVMAMTHERNGMGVPIITGPENASQAQLDDLGKLAQAYRAGEGAGGALPYGARLHLQGVEGTLPDPLPALEYYDTAIARALLEQFLQLGTGHSSGNRALGGVFVEFFAMAVDSIASEFGDQVTTEVVEHIVELNYGPDEPAPAIVAREVDAEADIEPAALTALIQAGAITMDDDLETFLRSKYRLPRRGSDPGRSLPPAAGPGGGAPGGSPVGAQRAPDSRPARVVRAAGTTRQVRMATRLEAYYSDQVALGLQALVDPREVVSRFMATVVAGRDPNVVAHAAAVLRSTGLDDGTLADVMAEAWGESYVAGTHVALGVLPASVVAVGPPWEEEVDWSSWSPGNAAAARELAGADGGRGLATMLSQQDVSIQGVSDTTVDLLAGQLADGIAAGENQASLAARLESVLADPARAEVIARTEINRAMNVAALDTYRDNGMGGRQWLAASDAEPDCADLNGVIVPIDANFPDGDPPLHPNCRCTVLPVLASEMPDAVTL